MNGAGAMAMPMNDAPTLPRALLPAIVAVALLALAMLAGHMLKPALDRPVQALRIDGQLSHLNATQIGAALALAPDERLFDLDLDTLRTRVEALPWVAHARVSRLWPSRLAIRVWERKPFALWGAGGLVDDEGHAFTPAPEDLPQGLPQLAGPAGREAEVMQAYQQMTTALADSRFVPTGLRLDARGDWTLATVAGIELRLGADDPGAKTALLLGAVTRTLGPKMDQVAYVDLRYTNGFSVGWKEAGCPASKAVAPGSARLDCGRKDAAQTINAPAKPKAAGAKVAPKKAMDSKHE